MQKSARPTTLELLREAADGAPDDRIQIEYLLKRFRERAFGMLLLLATLPAFIPLPIGVGAIAGPLVMLVGLQLLLVMERPWLPRFVRARGPRREAYVRFLDRVGPLLGRLERAVKPRWTTLTVHRLPLALTGALLILLGFLLALPIPFSNYPFGLLLLLFSMSLIERDGIALVIAWTLGGGTVGAFLLASDVAAAWVGRLLG